MNKSRIILNCFWITFVLFAWIYFVVFNFPEHYPGAGLPEPTAFENIAITITKVVMWPMLIVMMFAHTPSWFVELLLFVVTGLFWASVIELLLAIRRRYSERQAQTQISTKL